MAQVINAYLGMLALRQAGYRTTGTAIAELVDNSIEADASNIDILLGSDNVLINSRRIEQITTIGVLDDGNGMELECLESCLSMGWGTRLDTREGLGRFGFGLKGSSISQCQRVEVYTWQKNIPVHMTYLDFDDLKVRGKENELPKPEPKKLPSWVLKGFKEKISEKGTLVIWEKIDQANVKKPKTLVKRLQSELCRAYRHYLDDDDNYGTKRKSNVHTYHLARQEISETYPLEANDPLYLLTPNNVPGFRCEPTNEQIDCYPIDIKYRLDGQDEIKTSQVTITTSIAKPQIQALGGGSAVGKHYADNTGISFVRAGREIDLQTYNYIDRSESRHRWWGIEVRFEPVLDEYFGITNNKQSVRNIKKLSEEEMEEMAETGELGDQMLLKINKTLNEEISKLIRVVQHRRDKSRKDQVDNGEAETGLNSRVNNEIKKDKGQKTESEEKAKTKTKEEKIREKTILFMNDDSNLSEEEAEKFAEASLDNLIEIATFHWPGHVFLDRQPVANGSAAVINRSTVFYEDFWCYLENLDDPRGHEALQVILMAMIRAEDELVTRYPSQIFADFRAKWGEWAARLIPIVTSK